jgi:copper ion binding protein
MINTVVIKTEGMSCMHCENTIKTEVGKLDGVKEVLADHKTNIAKVTFDSDKTDITAIENEIKEWGYKVISVN